MPFESRTPFGAASAIRTIGAPAEYDSRAAAPEFTMSIYMTVAKKTPARRRWFSYSLRTFFVLVTLFSIWLAFT